MNKITFNKWIESRDPQYRQSYLFPDISEPTKKRRRPEWRDIVPIKANPVLVTKYQGILDYLESQGMSRQEAAEHMEDLFRTDPRWAEMKGAVRASSVVYWPAKNLKKIGTRKEPIVV